MLRAKGYFASGDTNVGIRPSSGRTRAAEGAARDGRAQGHHGHTSLNNALLLRDVYEAKRIFALLTLENVVDDKQIRQEGAEVNPRVEVVNQL